MLHKRRKKNKCPSKDNYTSTLPSLTFINNLLHSKSTYFYKWWNYTIPSVCILALLVGLYVSVNPICKIAANKTYATDIGEAINPGDDDIPSISISFPTSDLPDGFDNATSQITNASADTIAYRSNIFDVQAANVDIYHVGLRSTSSSNGELVGEQQNYIIPGVGENVAIKNFPDNAWGYTLTENLDSSDADLLYDTLPSNMDISKIETFFSSGNETKRFKVTFAAKFGKYAPSDHYKAQVSLFAIMDPRSTVGFNGALTMQEMSGRSSICNTAQIGDTGQLMDTRDKKMYWVARMADGNCWMTQNLDFDIPESLSAQDTNVPYDIELHPKRYTNATSVRSWGKDDNQIHYYDPGLMVKINASESLSCSKTALNDDTCIEAGWRDVSALGASAISSADSSRPVATSINIIVGDTYDSHYLVGNYYSWDAVTAGTYPALDKNASTPYDICPKGWKLPHDLSNTSNEFTDKTFAYLFRPYGLATSVRTGVMPGVGLADNTNTKGNTYNIYDAPLYFVLAGMVNESSLNAGYSGTYWTSQAYYNYAYVMNFYFGSSPYFSPSISNTAGNYRYRGLPARCVFNY